METENNLREPDYNSLTEELMKMIDIRLDTTPSFSSIASKVADVQAHKSRVCTILLNALRNLRGYEKLWEDVYNVEIVMRQEKSAEQRSAATQAKYSTFYNAFKHAETHKDQAYAAYQELIGISRDLETQLRAMQAESKLEGFTTQGPKGTTWETI